MKNVLLLSLLAVSLTACVAAEPATDGEGAAIDLKPAPAFELAAFPEGMLNSEELKGKVVVVDFWATWCQPCIKEIPHLNALYAEQDPEKFAMIGIVIESGSYEDIEAQLDRFDIEYPTLMGSEAVVSGFGGILGFPTKFVVGPDWTIYKRHMGGGENVKAQIEQDINELLGNTKVSKAF